MKDSQNLFYTSISKYYAEIFPYNPMQLQFVQNRAGELNGKQILDIGCATGELAFQLAEKGAKVTGIDLNEDLLKQAKSKKEHKNIHFKIGNMLDLNSDFQKESFDTVLCFGNTLVHLQNTQQIQQMLEGVFTVLKPGGNFLLQILNYDFILNEPVSELPLIKTDKIEFVRKYKFEESNPVIYFQTELKIKKENIILSNETPLFALRSNDLVQFLKKAGFKKVELFSNFKQDSFRGKHLPLVLSCTKK